MKDWIFVVLVLAFLAFFILRPACDDEDDAGEPIPEEIQYDT